MIALGIRYLTKYAVATNLARQQPEWPPHPGRVFMAMAAAHFDSGADPAEREALLWLENAPPPALLASEAHDRSTVRTYVPVNDDHGGFARRPKQDRGFPRTRPHDDCVFLIWQSAPPQETCSALSAICSKVTRIGHSMSAVQMWLASPESELQPNWIPDPNANQARLRIPAPGTLLYLEKTFNASEIQEYDALSESLTTAKGREKSRLKSELQSKFPDGRPESRRPQLVHWHGYSRPSTPQSEGAVINGPFDDNFIVLCKNEGPALGLESTLQLTRALRNRAMQPWGQQSPEWLSGHHPSGTPSLDNHLAFFPLPYVGFPHADGHILGLGIAVPRTIRPTAEPTAEQELRRFLGPLFFDPESGEQKDIHLFKPDVWDWTLARETRERPPVTLQRQIWTGPSRTWASVTPVVLHHYPKKRDGEVEKIVKEAFISALLPEPEAIAISTVSRHAGAGHALAVPPFTEGGASMCRYQTHVAVRFAQPLLGPVLVGRGRFRGYGLFRPLPDGDFSS